MVSGSGETVKLLEDYNDVGHKLKTTRTSAGIRVNSNWN